MREKEFKMLCHGWCFICLNTWSPEKDVRVEKSHMLYVFEVHIDKRSFFLSLFLQGHHGTYISLSLSLSLSFSLWKLTRNSDKHILSLTVSDIDLHLSIYLTWWSRITFGRWWSRKREQNQWIHLLTALSRSISLSSLQWSTPCYLTHAPHAPLSTMYSSTHWDTAKKQR